jgi:hypothetical protein
MATSGIVDLSSLIDTRSLGKPGAFSGREEDWAAWAFSFEAYSGLVHEELPVLMTAAEDLTDEPELVNMNPDQTHLSRALFAILVHLCSKGRALNIMMRTEKNNGLAAWRRLKAEFEPKLPGRHANMLSGLISPEWQNLSVPDFRDQFLAWEVAVQRYEAQSLEVVSDSLRLAIVSRHSSPDVRAAVRNHITTIGSSYMKLQTMVNEYF